MMEDTSKNYFKCGYTWSTAYGKERFEEQRTISVPDTESVDMVYAYQLITGADLTHMVIFNAHRQGFMEEDEFIEILASTREVLKKVVPYIKQAKEENSTLTEDMYLIYNRLRQELKEYDLWD